MVVVAVGNEVKIPSHLSYDGRCRFVEPYIRLHSVLQVTTDAPELSPSYRSNDNSYISLTPYTHAVPLQAQKDTPGATRHVIQRPAQSEVESKRELTNILRLLISISGWKSGRITYTAT